MNKRMRKLERKLKAETCRLQELYKYAEQQKKDMFFDNKSSIYNINRKIRV